MNHSLYSLNCSSSRIRNLTLTSLTNSSNHCFYYAILKSLLFVTASTSLTNTTTNQLISRRTLSCVFPHHISEQSGIQITHHHCNVTLSKPLLEQIKLLKERTILYIERFCRYIILYHQNISHPRPETSSQYFA